LKGQIVHQDRQVRIADRDQFLADTYPLALDIINVGEGYDVRAMYPAKTIPVQKLLEPLQADLREQGLAIDTVYLYIIAVPLEEKDLFPAEADDLAALPDEDGAFCLLLAQRLVNIGQSLVQFLEISHERVQGRGVSVESDTFQHSVFTFICCTAK